MPTTIKEIYHHLDGLVPFAFQESFDNAGFLVGRGERPVTKILISLDITEDVVSEASELGAELIISHHPVIFHPARSMTDGDPVGRLLLALAEQRIAAICAHTNLDSAIGGVNDALAKRLELTQIKVLHQSGIDQNGRPYGIGRFGIAPGVPQYTPAYAQFVKDALGANGIRYVDARRPVRQVAVGGGACANMIEIVRITGCDTFVTADAKYNDFLDAQAMGINLIDAGHYPTENVICPVLASWITKAFPKIVVYSSKRHHEVLSYL